MSFTASCTQCGPQTPSATPRPNAKAIEAHFVESRQSAGDVGRVLRWQAQALE